MSYDYKRVIQVAENEIGYLEKNDTSNLDDKTANAGSKNYTKYARDLDALGFYNGRKNGYAWCDVFVDWCFVQAYGVIAGRKLLCQPILSRGAGCRYSYGYYQEAGQLVQTPQEGDQIFFQREGTICHTGLVTQVDDSRVYAVEGNTSGEAGIVANGGCVAQKSYDLNDLGIAGYGRPDYAAVGE